MSVRTVAKAIASRIGGSCRLHRIYRITVDNNKYIGQTNRLSEERLKEHMRESSKCTRLKEAIKNAGDIKIETIAVVGGHQANTFERVVIAMENSVTPDGLNMTVGGRGVIRRNEKYENLRHDIALIRSLASSGKLFSYDLLFMKGIISMTEEEFKIVKRLVK